MASSWRHPRRGDDYDDEEEEEEEEDYGEEEEEDGEDDDYEEQEDDEEGTTGENSPTPYNMELHSMTAKGIKHLCSELLEINEASQEDFQRNIHLTYLSFLRLFQEAGDLEKDVDHLKRQAIAQRSLIQHLTDNLYSSSVVPDSSAIDPLDAYSPSVALAYVAVDQLDVLLSEHRMEEALELLEAEGQALEKLHSDDARVIASSMSALSVRRARVADRFASLADSPRTPPRRELLQALSGLCKLGDSQRANHLLFKYYRSDALRRVDELRCSSSSHRNYIKELARTVFSSVLEASRSFVALHGRCLPSSELSRWAREEIEDFVAAFREYVASVSEAEAGDGLVLATEAANCAVSYSSMLRTIVSEEDIMALIRPCMEEVLAKYAKHLKKVVRLLVSSDAWVLGKFLMSGILRRTPSPVLPIVGETEHCLLTVSGRKFVTLMQEIVEDVTPLLCLGMKSSVLQLLAGLFRQYTHSILAVDVVDQQQQYMWQLSFLINCTTLVSLFPIIAQGIFNSSSNSQASSNQAAQSELDGLVLFIKEASGQVWTQFCQQFIRDTMSSLLDKSRTTSSARGGGTMPCSAFQVVFLRLRRLSDQYGVILAGDDGTMRKLLQQLMEAIVTWLHNNLGPWISHHAQNNLPKDILIHQIQLDVHFLLQVAQFGGFSSDSIRTSALDLLSRAGERVSSSEHSVSSSGAIHQETWATDAAKRAVQALIGDGVNTSSSQEEETANSEDDVLKAIGASMARSAQESDEEIDGKMDDSVVSSGQSDRPETWNDEHAGSHALGETGCDGKSSDDFVSIEDDGVAAEGSLEDGVSPGSPLGTSTGVLDSEDCKLLENSTPIDVHGDGDSLNGLGGSRAAIEATPCDLQDEDDDESTLPEFLQDKMSRIPVASDQSGTDTTSVSSAEMESGDQHSDPGRGSSGGHGWRRRGAAAADKGGGLRKKTEGLSRSRRPRWRQ